MKREGRHLKTYLGRIQRDISRRISGNWVLQIRFKSILSLVDRLLQQKKEDSNKLYSLHAPETECIAKGKAHKKYKFGCKVSLAITHKEGLGLASMALHGNPYDGHTIKQSVLEGEASSGIKVETVFVDRGYKGQDLEDSKVWHC